MRQGWTGGSYCLPGLFVKVAVRRAACAERSGFMDKTDRISEEIKREISFIIQNELKDPRLGKMISVTAVDVTRDLRYAKVYVSVLGDENDKKDAASGLKSASGFIRREIGRRIQLRYTPEIIFELDDSIERGVYINKLINDTIQDNRRGTHAEEDSGRDG